MMNWRKNGIGDWRKAGMIIRCVLLRMYEEAPRCTWGKGFHHLRSLDSLACFKDPLKMHLRCSHVQCEP